jgi:hypothetical protein
MIVLDHLGVEFYCSCAPSVARHGEISTPGADTDALAAHGQLESDLFRLVHMLSCTHIHSYWSPSFHDLHLCNSICLPDIESMNDLLQRDQYIKWVLILPHMSCIYIILSCSNLAAAFLISNCFLTTTSNTDAWPIAELYSCWLMTLWCIYP